MNTSDSERQGALGAQFLLADLVIGGKKLRPFTAGVLLAGQKIGIRALIGGTEGLEETEKTMELLEILFLLSADVSEIKAACAMDRAAFREKYVEPFSFVVTVEDLGKIGRALQELGKNAADAAVEPVAKPLPAGAGEHEPVPPPNA